MESLEREERRDSRRRKQIRTLGTGRTGRKFLVAVFVVGNHTTFARGGNGDRSTPSSRSTSYRGMPPRSSSLQKNSGKRSSIQPTNTDTDKGSTAARGDKKQYSSKSSQRRRQVEAIDTSSSSSSSSILSSPFLDSFQEQVHEIVSEYRSEVRSTFQELAHDMLYHRERKMRVVQQAQLKEQQERKEAKVKDSSANAEADAKADEKEKQAATENDGDGEQDVHGEDGNADWDDEMDATLFAPDTNIDSESSPLFVDQERFDVFSDLAGDGDGTNDEVDNDYIVGDTDEEDNVVLGRLYAQSGLSQETSQGRSDGGNDDEAVESLESKLARLVEERKTKNKKKKRKKKKRKKKKKKSKKGHTVAEVVLEASDFNEDKLPVEVPSSGVSELFTSPLDNKDVAKVLRSMTSTAFFVIMYVITALLIKAINNVLKR
jgi:hypothetical protein